MPKRGGPARLPVQRISFYHRLKCTQRCAHEKDAGAACLFRIEIIEQCAQCVLVDLNRAWPAATFDGTTRIKDDHRVGAVPRLTFIIGKREFIRPFVIATDAIENGRQHDGAVFQNRQVVASDAEVGEIIQRLPGLTPIGRTQTIYHLSRLADRDRGTALRGTADESSLWCLYERHHAMISAIAKSGDPVLFTMINDRAIIKGTDPAVGIEFENRMPQAGVVC